MLQGVLLDLVPFDARFAVHARRWQNGPMHQWWGLDGLLSAPRFEQRERRVAEKPPFLRSGYMRFGLLTKDGTPIGSTSLMRINFHSRFAEVGAGIGEPAYWGGGYGSDAMLLLVEYAFDWLDLRRLWLRTSARNTRAQRQVERCGFRLEGRNRAAEFVDGCFYDNLFYGLLRDEWPGRPALIDTLRLHEKAQHLAQAAHTPAVGAALYPDDTEGTPA